MRRRPLSLALLLTTLLAGCVPAPRFEVRELAILRSEARRELSLQLLPVTRDGEVWDSEPCLLVIARPPEVGRLEVERTGFREWTASWASAEGTWSEAVVPAFDGQPQTIRLRLFADGRCEREEP